jgi:hypothetical protein
VYVIFEGTDFPGDIKIKTYTSNMWK